MAYTVTEAYNRVLQEADKLGSDYFPLPDVLSAFKKEVLDFVGARASEAEKNQEVTDDISPLVVSTLLNFTPNPDNNLEKMAIMPNDYHTKLRVNVLYSDGLRARKPTVERHGESNSNTVNPFKKAERMYPRIQQFSNYFNVITGLSASSPIQPDKFVIIYIKNPTFGKLANDVIVNLSDTVCELLFAATAASLRLGSDDPLATTDFQVNQTYRKK